MIGRLALLASLLLLAGAVSAQPRAPVHEDEEVVHEDASIFVPLPWALPPIDSCQPEGGLKGWPPGQDAPPLPFQPGDTFSLNELEVLEDFIPPFIWEYRDRFFYEGMRLEIGRCFADYSPPGFFKSATARFAGKPKLTRNDGLKDYTAGLPFPPDRLLPDDPKLGVKWAWNHELRYQGAGFWGDFRTSDMVGRDGRAEPFVGKIFKAQTAFRADRPDDKYRAPGARKKHWVVGGVLLEPFDARHYAWRQYRDVAHMTRLERSDDIHAYLPDYRRVRRMPGQGLEGIYMPSFSVGVSKPQTIAALDGGVGGGGAGSIGAAIGAITTKRSGFEGLELRPLLHVIKVLGVQDVLTPINAETPGYPAEKEREFGPWGLSFASDRWDLRRAIVLEGSRKEEFLDGAQVRRFILYLDVQTLAPLYYASWDGRDEQIDVGMFVGRWSEERPGYPAWPDDEERAIRVIDPVGSSFANIEEDGGWRRESWEIHCTPPDDRAFKRSLSVSNLTKHR